MTETKSNTYIGQGMRAGVHVMKVGKANDTRESQIAITIEYVMANLREDAAFRIETQLRKFVVASGGIRFPNTPDWFVYNKRIYSLLSDLVLESRATFRTDGEIPLDDEIFAIQMRYYELVIEEYQDEVTRLNELVT